MQSSQGQNYSVNKQTILWALGDTQVNPCVDRRFRFDPTKSKGAIQTNHIEINSLVVGEIMPNIQLNDWVLVNQAPYICRVIDFCKNIQSKSNKIREKTYWSRNVQVDNCENVGFYGQFYKIANEGQIERVLEKECLINCNKYAGHLPAPTYPGPVYSSAIVVQIQNIVSKIE